MTDPNRVRKDDPFLLKYQPSDLRIASEFLTTWLPYLSRDLCHHCTQILSHRIRSLDPNADIEPSNSIENINFSTSNNVDTRETRYNDNCEKNPIGSNHKEDDCDGDDTNSLGSWKDGASGWSEPVSEPSTSGILGAPPRISWADMAAQEDELEEEEEEEDVDVEEEQRELNKRNVNPSASTREMKISKVEKPKLSREQREAIRFKGVKRKKDFICLERIKGKFINVLEGLELHTGVFSAVEQNRIVNFVHELEEMGKRGELKG